MEDQLTEQVRGLVGHYEWLIVTAFVVLLFRKLLENLVSGFMFFWGKAFNVDDYVVVNGRKARIKSMGIRYTSFYMYDNKTILQVPNEKVKSLIIEKWIQTNPWIDENDS